MEQKIKKATRKQWTSMENPGSFLMISKHELKVDHSYQRDPRNSRVNNIARDWDWILFGAISISLRPEGEFYIMDGQHRHQAAMKRTEIDLLPCMVWEMDEEVNEARSYLGINSMMSAPTMAERFRVMVKLGDPLAVKLQALGDECGRSIDGNTRGNSIGCIARVLLHMKTWPEAFDRVWPVILEVCEGEGMNTRIVEGMVWLEHNMPEGKSLAQPTYRRILCSIGYSALNKQIAETVKYEDRSGMTIWGAGILKALNKRLKNRIELPT
jgi:hypothetical protein